MEVNNAKHHIQGDDSGPGRVVPYGIPCRDERTGRRPVSWRRTRWRLHGGGWQAAEAGGTEAVGTEAVGIGAEVGPGRLSLAVWRLARCWRRPMRTAMVMAIRRVHVLRAYL